MHSENAKKLACVSPAWLGLAPDEPQAVAATAQPMIAAAKNRRRRADERFGHMGVFASRPGVSLP
jgi:hypothetical protein